MQQWNEDVHFFNRLIFGDESTFHLSGEVNKHNVRIWGTESSRALVQYVRVSPKVKRLLCCLPYKGARAIFSPWKHSNWNDV